MINLIQDYFTDTNTAFNYLVLLRSFSTVDEFDHFYSSVYKTIVDRSSDIYGGIARQVVLQSAARQDD